MIGVLLPVKSMRNAKTRLSGILKRDERERLARAMLSDVGQAVLACAEARNVFIVSSDPIALDFARERGWEALAEPSQSSESDSVDRASSRLTERGLRTLLRLPCDLPAIDSRDLQALLHGPHLFEQALLVPSREGTGTNALLLSPPNAFPSHFGPDSRRLHVEAAHRRGISLTIVDNPRIALDLDTPDDLRTFLKLGTEGETRRLLLGWELDRILQRRRPGEHSDQGAEAHDRT